MTDWHPDFHWITPEIAVGGSFPSEHVRRLAAEHGVGAVVDLRDEAKDDEQLLRRHGIALLHLPTVDMCGVDPGHLASGVAFSCEQIERGARVLVHCEHGIGRSAVLGLCVMVQRGHSPLQALGLMKDRRALVSPSPEQFACWCGWLERHRRAHDVAWSVPSFDQFANIAYRHLARSA